MRGTVTKCDEAFGEKMKQGRRKESFNIYKSLFSLARVCMCTCAKYICYIYRYMYN